MHVGFLKYCDNPYSNIMVFIAISFYAFTNILERSPQACQTTKKDPRTHKVKNLCSEECVAVLGGAGLHEAL